MPKKFSIITKCGQKIRFIFLFILLAIASFLDAASSILIKKIINIATGNEYIPLSILIALLSTYLIVQLLLLFLIKYERCKYVYITMKNYKNFFIKKITYNTIEEFEKHNSSDFISSLTHDADVIENQYILGGLTITTQCFFLISAFFIMFTYSFLLTFTAIGLSLISVLVYFLVNKPIIKTENEVSIVNRHYISSLQDFMGGFSILKGLSLEAEINDQIIAQNNKLELKKRQLRGKKETANILSAVAGFISQIGCIAVGAMLIKKGNLSVGSLVAFLQLNTMWISPLQILPQTISEFNSAKSLIKLHSDLISKTDKTSKINYKIIPLNNSLELKNINVKYNGETILNDINMTLEAGKKYAIVGLSGAGKTTILKIISGLYSNYEGERIWDSKIYNTQQEIPIATLMNQNIFIFDDTLKNNILLYKEISQDLLNKTINQCGLNELVNKRGLDCKCGEGGISLSGGEKQKIALARCLIRNQSLMLLDEATSSLDKKNELLIIDTIFSIKNTTCVAVIHNISPSILCKFDKIYVIDNGCINESGTYKNLIDKKGTLYSMLRINSSI